MRLAHIERWLASLALGLIVAGFSHAVLAQKTQQRIESAIPKPDTSPLPPLTLKDIEPGSAKSAATTASPKQDTTKTDTSSRTVVAQKTEQQIELAIPKPDTSPLPPLTLKDIEPGSAKSAATTASPKQDTAKTMTPPAAVPANVASAPQATHAASNMDSQVADQLRDIITSRRLDHFLNRKEDREGAERFYKERDYKPLWTSNGMADTRAKTAIAFLAQVQTDGLIPSDYPTPEFSSETTPQDLAQADLLLTASVLKYALQAQIGRINPTRVGNDISFKLVPPEPFEVLSKLAATDDVANDLDSYNPPQAGFKALRAKLAELRANDGVIAKPEQTRNLVRIPEGRILRPGMTDPRVVLLRKRLDIVGDNTSTLFDQDVADAVKAFQTKADIGVDGLLGPNTVRALNGVQQVHNTPLSPIDTVIVNMERWRWLPRKLGNEDNDYVMTNIPDYSLSLYHHGQLDWHTIIVAGKPGKATPMLAAEMKYITVNPIWNVPPSIVENEYLPALQEDPTVLDRYGLKIYQDADGTVHIFQPPGPANALGRIRFNFPNKFLVYQHDTPDKYLFKRANRAYSHGCMRVQNPLEYATKLLSIELPQDHYTPAKIESMYGPDEININFPHPIPVYVVYETAFVDQYGKLQFRDDVYGRDAKMIAILKNNAERKVADIPVELQPNTSDKPVRLPVGTYGTYSEVEGGFNGDYYSGGGGGPNFFGAGGGGPNFFDWLFGSGQRQPYYYSRR